MIDFATDTTSSYLFRKNGRRIERATLPMFKQQSRVLVVDDNDMSRNLIKYRLEMEGIEVVPLSSGEEALEAIKQGNVSLIFLDLLMEGMNGLDVLWSLKAEETYQDIPVVIVSGVEDASVVDEVLHAGAADFLPKPVTAAALSEIVADLIGTKESDGALQEVPLDPEDYPVFDSAPLAQLVKDYGTETVDGFISRFIQLAPEKLGAAVAAERNGESEEWRRAVSGLKGGARTLGLVRLATACRIIERALDKKQLGDAAKAASGLSDHLGTALAKLTSPPAS